jgi:hypothetical protein
MERAFLILSAIGMLALGLYALRRGGARPLGAARTLQFSVAMLGSALLVIMGLALLAVTVL